MERSGLRFYFFAHKGCKIVAHFFFDFLTDFALLAGFFLVSVLLSASIKRWFVSRMRDFFSITLGISACMQPVKLYPFHPEQTDLRGSNRTCQNNYWDN